MRSVRYRTTLALLSGLAVTLNASCGRGQKPRPRAAPAPSISPAASAPPVHDADAAQAPGSRPSRADVALSLKRLQKALQSGSADARTLGGVNRVRFVMKAPDGDVLLVGETDPGRPRVHVDDLAVALRNAAGVPGYAGEPIGCTIDPRYDDADPWSIQEAKVFGMPAATTRMAARHVALDYELKRVGAGLLSVPGIEGTFAARMRSLNLCGPRPEGPANVQHRFWFYPATPPRPRFASDGDVIEILRPVAVRLLTERELRDGKGVRQGATGASPEADRFAREVSAMLQNAPPPRYASLVADFQIIEVAALIRRLGQLEEALGYLLHRHRLDEVEANAFVAGVFRDEAITVLCDARLEQRREGDAVRIRVHKNVQTAQVSYRGGVEARVTVEPESFDERPGQLSPLVARVLGTQPPEPAFVWPVVDSL